MTEILDVVNEKDEVIGQVDRDNVLNSQITRRIAIGFYTQNKKIILQKRSLKKKTSPGKLTVTVSGHVESGMSYDDTAIKEALEETGITINATKLVNLGTFSEDQTMRTIYAYPFDGNIEDLKIEENEADGFVLMDIDDLLIDRNKNPQNYSPYVKNPSGTALLEYIVATT